MRDERKLWLGNVVLWNFLALMWAHKCNPIPLYERNWNWTILNTSYYYRRQVLSFVLPFYYTSLSLSVIYFIQDDDNSPYIRTWTRNNLYSITRFHYLLPSSHTVKMPFAVSLLCDQPFQQGLRSFTKSFMVRIKNLMMFSLKQCITVKINKVHLENCIYACTFINYIWHSRCKLHFSPLNG